MNLKDFCRSIKFKTIGTKTKTSELFINRISPEQEISNTILPEVTENLNLVAQNCFTIPKMATFATGAIINKIVSEMSEEYSFVNIGVWCGYTFFSGIANNTSKKCIGVDNFSEFSPEESKPAFYNNFSSYSISYKNIEFYESDYQDYFNHTHKGTIGFYIYDGEHSYKNQLKGLQIAEPFFSNDCVILVDDTNFPEVRKSVLDFISNSQNKYEILFDVRTANNCHPTFWNGIMLFKRVK